MEWKIGFDATPYMDRASWGEPKYKKVTDEETGQKLSMGDGCKIHPDKKHRFKLQGETDPDNKVNTGLARSRRSAVAVIRPKGSDYIPVIEGSQKIVSTTPDGLLDGPNKADFGAPDWNNKAQRYGGEYYSREKEWLDSDNYQRYVQEKKRIEAHNDALKIEHFEWTRGGKVIPTDTVEFAYKRFRLEAADLLEHAKREHRAAGDFYPEHAFEIQAHALNACEACGVSPDQLRGYIHNAGLTQLAEVIEDPGAYRDKIKASKKRQVKRAPKVKTQDIALEDMTVGELQAERNRMADELEELNRRYSRIMGELLSREDPDIWKDQTGNSDPDPDTPASAPTIDSKRAQDTTEGDTMQSTTECTQANVEAVATRAEKRAAMRAAKAARKAQRRQTRKMLRKVA